jgi:probable F420-dependent oxidoreductase
VQIGAVFPQIEARGDAAAIRAFIEAVEEIGFDHVVVFDHVLGADRRGHPERGSGWGLEHPFHEALVLLGYFAGLTSRIGLSTGILILPQRQTALVAKQAAEIDLLSNGRLRLGIGTGWNRVEYEALGADWSTRGTRSEEQVEVMRALWRHEVVAFRGRWHTIDDAGLNPMPVQRPIPVWLGGKADPVLRRIARIGDGWFFNSNRDRPADAAPQIETLRGYLREVGRDPADFGIESWIMAGVGDTDAQVAEAIDWRAVGATHVSLNTVQAGLDWPDGHIATLRRFMAGVRRRGLA